MNCRDWAVRVLDAWADWHGGGEAPANAAWRCRPLTDDYECELQLDSYDNPRSRRWFNGVDADAARLAAAQAVFAELPEAVQQELGVCP